MVPTYPLWALPTGAPQEQGHIPLQWQQRGLGSGKQGGGRGESGTGSERGRSGEVGVGEARGVTPSNWPDGVAGSGETGGAPSS